MRIKITYSKENIKSFGGINFDNNILEDAFIFKIIDENLKSRRNRAIYAYRDLFTGDNFTYRAIMINNREMTNTEVFRFMLVPLKWIKRGRQQILKLFSTREYHLIL